MTLEAQDRPAGFWPVYKGESFEIWNPDTGVYYAWADPEPVLDWLQQKRLRGAKNVRSQHHEFSINHLRDRTTLPCFAPRVAFRDVARATDSRTVIACLLPPMIFVADTAPYFLWPRGDERDQAFLLGVLCSIPLDWYARRFVETHLKYFILNPLPVPRQHRHDRRWQRVVQLAGRLACPDDRFASWAKKVGVDYGPLAPEEQDHMIHEIDAVVANLYGLYEHQLVHIFQTFHKGWDYDSRLDGVLRHFRAWSNRS